ncbi:MAG: hypothetical protein M0P73_02235 [Syntrophobacterales bacterium]|jgi:hypothetical protein|nr:hypothetical protein [Syntrophobacterales bacterium]
MHAKIRLIGMAAAALLLIVLALGCASSSGYKNPDVEATKQRTLGTPDELSPLAPVGGQNVRKVGNQWTCEQNGRLMIYNDAASCWEPKQK